MTYFTSWDVNVFLCLFSLGIPHDLASSMVEKIKGIHRDHCLEDARAYHCNREEWVSEEWMLADRDRGISIVNWGYGHKEFNMRAIVDIKSLPFFFWNNLGKMIFEYVDTVRKIEPEDRNEYFEWAYENHYHGWDNSVLEWVKGFHPGRFLLMDHKRNVGLEEIRDLEDIGARQEEKFIRNQKHIDEYLTNLRFK